jgi:hypothetical protein
MLIVTGGGEDPGQGEQRMRENACGANAKVVVASVWVMPRFSDSES